MGGTEVESIGYHTGYVTCYDCENLHQQWNKVWTCDEHRCVMKTLELKWRKCDYFKWRIDPIRYYR
ncbi:MAG: hypothetical protein ACE5GD_02910, partial [Candidatus Geothermarchaeales archaeon]